MKVAPPAAADGVRFYNSGAVPGRSEVVCQFF
jgi:hypothetical protein